MAEGDTAWVGTERQGPEETLRGGQLTWVAETLGAWGDEAEEASQLSQGIPSTSILGDWRGLEVAGVSLRGRLVPRQGAEARAGLGRNLSLL